MLLCLCMQLSMQGLLCPYLLTCILECPNQAFWVCHVASYNLQPAGRVAACNATRNIW